MLAVTNNGQSDQGIQLIDPEKMLVLDSVITAKSWLGLTFSKDGKYLYASGGNDNWIMRYLVSNKKLVPYDTFVYWENPGLKKFQLRALLSMMISKCCMLLPKKTIRYTPST